MLAESAALRAYRRSAPATPSRDHTEWRAFPGVEGFPVRMLLICRPYDTVVGDVLDAGRRAAGQQWRKMLDSGKVTHSGTMGATRGTWFLVDVETPTELHALLGPIPDYCHVEAYASAPLEDLLKLFEDGL
jgi:hypothetical protein